MQKYNTLVLLDIDDVLFDTNYFIQTDLSEYKLYPDVSSFLENLSHHAEIGILSQGEHAFQLKKLTETGIHTHFATQHIHIVPKKDMSLLDGLHEYKKSRLKIYFVDDRISGLYYAKQAVPEILTIQLLQGRYVDTQEAVEGFSPDYVISSLHEVLAIVQK